MREVMSLIVLCLFAVAPGKSNGQERSGTVYFDKNWEKAEQKDAVYVRTYELSAGFIYKAEDRYVAGNRLQMTGFYSSMSENGVRTGHFVYYTDSGFVSSEGEYVNDKKAGLWTNYYDNTKLPWYTENYKDGQLDGELRSYYKSGKVKRVEIHQGGNNSAALSGKCYDEDGKEIAFTPFENMPYPTYDMNRYLNEHLEYPQSARRHNIQGRVIVQFVVDEKGKITNIDVVKHVSPELDAEAIRVLAKMPEWLPAMQDDRLVKVLFTQPISFTLQ